MHIQIFADPMPAPRPRFAAGRTYMPHQYVKWVDNAAEKLRTQREFFEGPVRASLDFVFRRPRGRPPKHAADSVGRFAKDKRPDIDNLAKTVLDAATKAGIWRDDSQVTELDARKWYAAKGEQPCVWISFTSVSGGIDGGLD